MTPGSMVPPMLIETASKAAPMAPAAATTATVRSIVAEDE